MSGCDVRAVGHQPDENGATDLVELKGRLASKQCGPRVTLQFRKGGGRSDKMQINSFPGERKYNRRGGRPGLNLDFEAVCDAVLKARNGSGETMTDIATRFEVSRGWLHKWVYPALVDGNSSAGSLDA